MGKLLEARNLTKKYYEGTAESRAVDNVDLEVDEGEFVIIMGASGSGKTSLLHLLAGIDDFDEGTIRYKNVDFGHMGEKAKAVFRRANIGIVFQQHCLIPDLTIYENIMLPVMLDKKERKKEKDSMKDTILNLCEQFGLKEHISKYPSQLSGGQQQRAAILRAVVNKPPLLLCDEPTGSLNSAQSDIVMALLDKLNQKGQTIILVTHDTKVAVRGKRMLYIEDGSVGGELDFVEAGRKEGYQNEGCQNAGYHKEAYRHREVKLLNFLHKKGW